MIIGTTGAPLIHYSSRYVYFDLLPLKPNCPATPSIGIIESLHERLPIVIGYQIVHSMLKEAVCEVIQVQFSRAHERSNVLVVSPITLLVEQPAVSSVVSLFQFIH